MGFLLKIGSLLGIAKKPLEVINRAIDTPGWKGKTGAIVAMLGALAGLLLEINRLAPLDLNDLAALAKSEYIMAFGLALSAFGIRKKQEEKLPNQNKLP